MTQGSWKVNRQAYLGGRFQLVITKLVGQGRAVDVTKVRSAYTQLVSYSSADPFGDSTAVFQFPALTAADDLTASDLGQWLGYYSNVDLYWVPAQSATVDLAKPRYVNPLTEQADVISPAVLTVDGHSVDQRTKVWEGFLADMGFTTGPGGTQLEIQCQGALFQVDRYLMKPFYPSQPWPIEELCRLAFNNSDKPHLRTKPLSIIFPDGWTKVVPAYPGSSNDYTPVAKPGTKWTGFTSRSTGAWDHALTGFVQDQLVDLITTADSGVTPGNQWTILQQHASATSAGRKPIMMVRDRFRTPDFSMWVGTPGMDLQLDGDSTQSENVVYGDGTDLNGEVWRNAVISSDGSRTDYLPLAASRTIYPYLKNKAFLRGAFASEAYVKFGTGFAQTDATTVAAQQVQRDEDPGWTGTITLATDPSQDLPRWFIRAGMTILLKGFLGTGATGYPLHIASVEADMQQGTVQLTVDSRYRDLLTIAEAMERTHDPLTPTKMLQVGKQTAIIEDLQAPWDYSAGSGFIPKGSLGFFRNLPKNQIYPYESWAEDHPPLHYPSLYVKCDAGAPTRTQRWAGSLGAIPVLTSEKGTIARTQIAVYDIFGKLLRVPFHVSFYYYDVDASDMPRDSQGPSPFINNAFEKVDATGQPTNQFLWPDQSFIIGWGNRANGITNAAGYSPGSQAEGGSPTGEFFDDATWTYDNTFQEFFQGKNLPGKRAPKSEITIYAMFYCEYTEPVYFMGRLYRQNPGQS